MGFSDRPNMKKGEVMKELEVDDGRVLKISGEWSEEKKNDSWHRVGILRSCGKLLRRFRPSENARVDQVKAAMENGVLIVTVPKEEVKKQGIKSIEISGE